MYQDIKELRRNRFHQFTYDEYTQLERILYALALKLSYFAWTKKVLGQFEQNITKTILLLQKNINYTRKAEF